MAKEEEYTELFVIEYEGEVSTLKQNLEDITGLEYFSLSRPGFRLHDSMTLENSAKIHADIRYNTHQTDRTQIMNTIDTFDGVTTSHMG